MDLSNISPRTKRIALVAAIAVVALIVIVLLTHSDQPAPANIGDGTTGRKYDPTSHETISNPTGKSPDTYGTNGANTVFLGTAPLTDQGLSSDQLSVLKTAFANYARDTKQNLQYVSIAVDNITSNIDTSDPDYPVYSMAFPVVINLKTKYQAKISYEGLTDLDLFLSDTTGKLVYDSGILDINGD